MNKKRQIFFLLLLFSVSVQDMGDHYSPQFPVSILLSECTTFDASNNQYRHCLLLLLLIPVLLTILKSSSVLLFRTVPPDFIMSCEYQGFETFFPYQVPKRFEMFLSDVNYMCPCLHFLLKNSSLLTCSGILSILL